MSSMSMNHGFHSHPSTDSSSFSFPPFDGSSSSFAINPASQLPPSGSLPPLKARTPRTSVISRGSVTELTTYTEKGESEAGDEISVEGGGKSDRNGGVRKMEVWRDIVASSNGRDKALKLIQYSIRVYLLFHLRSSALLRRPKQGAWEMDAIKRLEHTASGLSLARKCMLLFNWLAPLTQITAPQSLPFSSSMSKFPSSAKAKPRSLPLLHRFLHAPPPLLLDLLSSTSDDIATFFKLGLLPRRIGQRAERMADWCWFAVTIVGLIEVGVERGMVGGLISEVEGRIYQSTMTPGSAPSSQAADEAELEKLKKQYAWLQVSRAKLVMDLIFVSYECFNLKPFREPTKALTGLASAVLSSAKLFDRQRATLASSMV